MALSGKAKREPRAPFSFGFTLPELIAVLLILGILSAVAVPRFWGSEYDQARFYDEATSALRFAQRSAVAMQRTVCVTFTATTVTLTYDSNYGTSACAVNLPGPGGAPAPYTVSAQGAASFAPVPTNFNFDRVGRPSLAQTITASGRAIVVEPESGYVH
jgi:MSHA pilin protein MshC